MIIRQQDWLRANNFIDACLNFFKEQAKYSYYLGKPLDIDGILYLKTRDGHMVVARDESLFVLPNEFKYFLIDILIKFTESIHSSLENPISAFAQRSYYEFVTKLFALVFTGNFPDDEVERFKALLFLGNYIYISEEKEEDCITYLEYVAPYLTPQDFRQLDVIQETAKYYDYVKKELDNLFGRKEFVGNNIAWLAQNSNWNQFIGHLHMRVHGNPFSLNETLGDSDKSTRNLLFLVYMLRQVVEYLNVSYPEDYRRLSWQYAKFEQKLKLTL